MAELVVQWLDYGSPARPLPGHVIDIYPDGTLDGVTPAPNSHVNFVHVEGLSVETALRLLEQHTDEFGNMIGRRRFWANIADLPTGIKTQWQNHQPITVTLAQARNYIKDHYGSEAWG